MRIPIDDDSCYMYRFRWSYEPFTEKQKQTDRFGGFTYPEQIPGTFMAVENKDNDYLVDRILQKNYSYTGIKSFRSRTWHWWRTSGEAGRTGASSTW